MTYNQWQQYFENWKCNCKRPKAMQGADCEHANVYQAMCSDKRGVFACSTTFSRAHSKIIACRDPQLYSAFVHVCSWPHGTAGSVRNSCILYDSLSPSYMPSPLQLPTFHHPKNSSRPVQITQCLVMYTQISPLKLKVKVTL